MKAKTKQNREPRKKTWLPREKAAYTVTVCAACRRASCWQGEFYCEDYKTADTAEETRTALALLALESSHYWTPQAQYG